MRHWIICTLLIGLCGSISLAEPPTEGAVDWPHVAAHNRGTPPQGYELIDDLNQARKVFETTDSHAGVGKGLYGSQRQQGEEIGVDVLPGGTSSMIIADDTIYIAYYRPSGDVRIPGEDTTFRTIGSREGWNRNIWSISADDCLLAIDRHTGEQQWVASHEGKGVNRIQVKRNDWGSSPVHHDGKVFFVGTTGRVYAHDASSGELLWESATPGHEWMEADKAEALEEGRWAKSAGGLHTSPRVAEGVLVTPALINDGLSGFDTDTGKMLWTLAEENEQYMSPLATPRVWTHEGREYILAHNGGGTLRLIDPEQGTVLWRQGGNARTPGSIPLEDDIVLTNVWGNEQGDALYGAYRISPEGAEKLWMLPEGPKYTHQSQPDSGPRAGYAVRDGVAWLWTGNTRSSRRERDGPRKEDLLLAVDIETGEILSETLVDQKHMHPQVVEDKLLLWADASHGDSWRASYYTADAKDPKQLTDVYGLPISGISGYLVVMDTPFVASKLYMRTMGGVACFDMRSRSRVSERRGEAPLTVTFEALRWPGDPEDVQFAWKFGDGQTGQGERVEHTYREPDAVRQTYQPRLTVVRDDQREQFRGPEVTVWRKFTPSEPKTQGPGLRVEIYEDEFTDLPDLATRTPVADATVKEPSAAPGRRDEQFALRFTGALRVPDSGVYRFFLHSDDLSRLYINGELVARRGEMSPVSLEAGTYTLGLDYVQFRWGKHLRLLWAPPGQENLERVPADAYRRVAESE